MSSNRVALDLAAFLDSPEALRLDAPSTGEIRRLVEAFLEVCYLDLGKAPHLLEDHDVEAALRQLLARRLKPRDPEAEHVPAVLAAFFDFLEGAKPVMHAYEIRRALDAHGDAVVEAVRSDETPRVRRKQDPFVHGAPKLNRNDPCSCGSGKKYKKCHGKNA